MEKKRKRKVVNMKLKAPAEVHALVVLHQSHLSRDSKYEISQQDAHVDLLKKVKTHPELQHLR